MDIDTDRIDQAVLALLRLGLQGRLPGLEVLRLERDGPPSKGFISNPASKAKSVALTDEGLRESERLFQELVGARRAHPNACCPNSRKSPVIAPLTVALG